MKSYLVVLVALMVTLFGATASAYTPPPAPASGWYVVDQAGKMSASQMTQLNQKIELVSKATKNEFGVLLLQDMGGDNIEDVANATYKAWGVGKRGLDNGCLIVVAIKEHKSRIETGKGVGGEVSDIQSNDILKKSLNPHLKSGDFYGGFDATLDALSGLMESRANQKAEAPPVSPVATPVTQSTTAPQAASCDVSGAGQTSGSSFLVVVTLIGLAGALAIYLARFARRKREEEALEKQLVAQRRQARLDKINAEQARLTREREARAVSVKTDPLPFIPVRATIPPPYVPVAKSAVRTAPRPTPRVVVKAPVAAAVNAQIVAKRIEEQQRRDQEARDDERRRARQREQDDQDRRDRDREEAAAAAVLAASVVSSLFDFGSSGSSSNDDSSSSDSSSGSDDSGGGFGGGDSGGGGSSSDW